MGEMKTRLSLEKVLGPRGPGIVAAMRAGARFLDAHGTAGLLSQVGRTIRSVPTFRTIDKSALQDSFGGNQTGPSDDFLVGHGLFYLNERRKLFLDCTSGHYQMLWGYNHPELCAAVEAASHAGVTWDNHSNIPQTPLKWLAHRLVALGNAPGEKDPLDTVLLGVCTGSVACAAALKIQLRVFEQSRGRKTVPVMIALAGNYHGTDMLPQFMRGMWPGMMPGFELVTLEPNDGEALEKAFRKHGARVAGFWAEPVMMNREAIALDPDFLRLAQRCCREAGALLCVDEIQTCFWRPEVFEYRALSLQPDLLVLGKGMTAGFHPLSGVLFRHRHDVLEQYDAISTNGSAALPAFVALASLELIRERSSHIRAIAERIQCGFQALADEFPARLQAAHGRGHLAGLKFHEVEDARGFHRALMADGLWTRVHAYHAGHRTVLTKLGLLADETVVDFVLARFRKLLREAKS
jgi:acetylornithine/succinyldiaminopimelate/putrescine aminotransferase